MVKVKIFLFISPLLLNNCTFFGISSNFTEKNNYEFPLRYTLTDECDVGKVETPFLIEANGTFSYKPLKDISYTPPIMSLREGSRKLSIEEISRIKNFLNNSELENLEKQITKTPPDSMRPAVCSKIINLTVKKGNSEKTFNYQPFVYDYPFAYRDKLFKIEQLLTELKNINPGSHNYIYDIPIQISSNKFCYTRNNSNLYKDIFSLKENGILHYNFIGDYHPGGQAFEDLPYVKLSEQEIKEVKEFLKSLNIATEGEKSKQLSEKEITENINQCDRISDNFYFNVNGRFSYFGLEDRGISETETLKESLNELKSYLTKIVNKKLEGLPLNNYEN